MKDWHRRVVSALVFEWFRQIRASAAGSSPDRLSLEGSAKRISCDSVGVGQLVVLRFARDRVAREFMETKYY